MVDLLRSNYISRLERDISELENLLSQLNIQHDKFNPSALQRKAHGLSGSGTTFGFPLISEKGAKLEVALRGNDYLAKDLIKLTTSLLDECKRSTATSTAE